MSFDVSSLIHQGVEWLMTGWEGLWAYISALFVTHPLFALFLSGFLSATLLPGSSELTLYASLQVEPNWLWVVGVASLGNTLGGMVNYFIGKCLPNRTLHKKYGHKIESMVMRYGYWALLLSWLPIIGDPLCVAAGWMRMRFLPCLVCIFIGKAIRYALLAAVYLA